jgi:peroxiredoxin Q/BCP
MMSTQVEVGGQAPDFVLTDQTGARVSLAERTAQHVVVLFFYPRDNSMGCTREACAFRDSYTEFQAAGAEVIGISGGTTATKQEFVEKNHLPFTLLTDADGAVARAYALGKAFFGLVPARVTFVIDRHGIIRHRFESGSNMDKHVTEALRVVRSLTSVPA